MNEPPPSDQEDFQQELQILRSLLKRARQDPFLDGQLEFWLESARFLETEINIWEKAGNSLKHDQAVERMHKVLAILQQLIDQMNKGMGDGDA